MTDQEARKAIVKQFYDVYLQGGLHVIVDANQVAQSLQLDTNQAKRCFDYLSAKGILRPMTLGGGYSPTAQLVDVAEEQSEVR
jgi:predicted ArsR family transcriptional regulator